MTPLGHSQLLANNGLLTVRFEKKRGKQEFLNNHL